MSLTPRLDRLDKNYIINGNFDFWQRSLNATGLLGPGYAAADRFSIRGSNLGTSAMSRSTNVPTTTSAILPSYSLLYSCTGTAVQAAGDLRAIGYAMEGNDLRSLAGKTFTVAFWVRSFQTGTFGFSIKNAAGTRAYHTTYTINNSNTWEYKTLTMTHDMTGSWNYDNSSGLELAWILAVGTSFQTSTFNSWTNDNNFRGPTSQPYFYSSTSNYFQLSQVQLLEGTHTDPEFTIAGRNYAEELQLCQRYYTKTLNVDVSPTTPAGDTVNWIRQRMLDNNSDGKLNLRYHFPVTMRGIPSAQAYSPVTGAAGVIRDQTAAVDRTASIPVASIHHVQVTNSGVGYVLTNNYAVHITADAEL